MLSPFLSKVDVDALLGSAGASAPTALRHAWAMLRALAIAVDELLAAPADATAAVEAALASPALANIARLPVGADGLGALAATVDGLGMPAEPARAVTCAVVRRALAEVFFDRNGAACDGVDDALLERCVGIVNADDGALPCAWRPDAPLRRTALIQVLSVDGADALLSEMLAPPSGLRLWVLDREQRLDGARDGDAAGEELTSEHARLAAQAHAHDAPSPALVAAGSALALAKRALLAYARALLAEPDRAACSPALAGLLAESAPARLFVLRALRTLGGVDVLARVTCCCAAGAPARDWFPVARDDVPDSLFAHAGVTLELAAGERRAPAKASKPAPPAPLPDPFGELLAGFGHATAYRELCSAVQAFTLTGDAAALKAALERAVAAVVEAHEAPPEPRARGAVHVAQASGADSRRVALALALAAVYTQAQAGGAPLAPSRQTALETALRQAFAQQTRGRAERVVVRWFCGGCALLPPPPTPAAAGAEGSCRFFFRCSSRGRSGVPAAPSVLACQTLT